jgi:hypothetical protein
MPVTATITKRLVLTFSLPGVAWQQRSGGGAEYQLNTSGSRDEESWTLGVQPGNVAETARRLREVVAELERFEATERAGR